MAPSARLAILVLACASAPATAVLERPAEFHGAWATQLNAWVEKHWRDEKGCDGELWRRLRVLREAQTLVLFADQGEAACSGAPHPVSWNEEYLVDAKKGETLVLWDHLSPAGRERLKAKLVARGQAVWPDDAGGEHDCAELYGRGAFEVRIKLPKGNVEVEPVFAYAMRACAESVALATDEFEQLAEPDSVARAAIDALR